MAKNFLNLRCLDHLRCPRSTGRYPWLCLQFISNRAPPDIASIKSTAVNRDTEQSFPSHSRKVGVTSKEQQRLMCKLPQQPENPHTLKVAIIGSPNAGKSTLANRLLGWKIAPVSEKVHTTRKKTLGVLTEGNKQLIFLDTPGMIEREIMKKHSLGNSLLFDPHSSLFEADLVLTLVDVSTSWGRQRLDMEVLKVLHFHPHKKAILVLNKVDLVKPKKKLLQTTRLLTSGIVAGMKHSATTKELRQDLDPETLFKKMAASKEASFLEDKTVAFNASNFELSSINKVTEETWKEYHQRLRKIQHHIYDNDIKGWPHFDHVFMISAKDGGGVREVKEYLLDEVQPGEWEYPEELVTPQPALELARQCVWEQCMNHLPREIPYRLHISVDLWDFDEDGMLRTAFTIICRGSRPMKYIVGKDGENIRRIARDAKQALLDTFRCELSFKLYARSADQNQITGNSNKFWNKKI